MKTSCVRTLLLLGLLPAWAQINVRFTPAAIARPQAGPVTLERVDGTGKPASQKVVVVKPLTRVTLP